MNQAELDQIKARAAAATPGPWVTVNGLFGFTGYGIEQSEAYGDDGEAIIYANNTGQIAENDAAFIAHARADVPALVAEVERLTAALAVAEKDTERLIDAVAFLSAGIPEAAR